MRRWFPFIERILADAGYQAPKMAKAVADTGCWTLQIVKRTYADAEHCDQRTNARYVHS